jgi:hypothetical protein
VLHVEIVGERRVHNDRVEQRGLAGLKCLEWLAVYCEAVADPRVKRPGACLAECLGVRGIHLDRDDVDAPGEQLLGDPAEAGARLQHGFPWRDAGEADHALRQRVRRLEEAKGFLGVNDNAVLDHRADQLARVEGKDVAVGLPVPFAARGGQDLGDAQIGFAGQLLGEGEDVAVEGAAAKDGDHVVWHSRSGGGHGGISLWQEGAAVS